MALRIVSNSDARPVGVAGEGGTVAGPTGYDKVAARVVPSHDPEYARVTSSGPQAGAERLLGISRTGHDPVLEAKAAAVWEAFGEMAATDPVLSAFGNLILRKL